MSKRNVSPDSSTQPKEEHKKSKKRKQLKQHSHGRSHKNKKKKKEEKKTDSVLQVPSDSSSTKYSKKKNSKRKNKQQESPTAIRHPPSQIKPLGEYVDDQKELYKQLLSIISKKEMKEMLPDILKKEDMKEVKRLCLEQLKATPIGKLKDIISGKDTSSSGDEEKELNGDQKSHLEAMVMEEAPAEEKDTSAGSIVEEKKDAEIFEELITAPNQEDIDELVEGRCPVDIEQEQDVEDHSQDSAQAPPLFCELPGPADEKPANEELELKELEYRARALKSLVQARERQMSVTSKSPDAGSSVDGSSLL